jgi:hypothetical protein
MSLADTPNQASAPVVAQNTSLTVQLKEKGISPARFCLAG